MYQIEIIEKCRAVMLNGTKSILIQAPTGAGKTLLTAHMLKTAAARGMNSWFCVHRRELIKQSVKAFNEVGIKFGIVSAGFDENPYRQVQICSVQTLARRLTRHHKPRLIVWDEAHHIASKSWDAIHKSQSDAFHIGLTATPQRLDGTGLGKWFSHMISGPTVQNLIEQSYLSPYRLFAPATINTSGLHTKMGDFVKSELSAVVDKPTITGSAIREYQKLAPGKRAVVFCVSIEHSKHVVSQFQAAGIPAAHVDGETNVEERDNAIQKFQSGEILVLSNVDLFGEGFDLPSIEVAILLRPTQSLGLYLQQVGRSLRPAPGKREAIILDHAGNVQRHGLPDEERNWSLVGCEKRKSAQDGPVTSVRICEKCFAAQVSGSPSCQYCQFVFEIKAREVAEVAGELAEVDLSIARRGQRREQGMAQTREELVAIGRSRGMKNPYGWAHFILQARQRRKLSGYR
jgi:superfamily II DNA or RNA helicase